jgi:hypothetical protein
LKMIQMRIMNLTLKMTWKTLAFSQYMYGDFNVIPNSSIIVENIVVTFPNVVPIIFCHMDPIMFHTRMKDFCDAPHVNSILQHFKFHLLNSTCIWSQLKWL